MKTKLITITLMSILMLGFVFVEVVFAQTDLDRNGIPGSGTEHDPYIITDVYQLKEMNNDLDGWYELANDIDASETKNWNDGNCIWICNMYNN